MRNKLSLMVTVCLLVMLLIGLNNVCARFPVFSAVYQVAPFSLVANWVRDNTSLFNLVVDLCLVLFPVFAWAIWRQERRARMGDYVFKHANGTIVVTEIALKRFIRSICREVPDLVDVLVDLTRTGAGINVLLRVKVEKAESWPEVRSELLGRIPDEVARVIDENVIGSLDIILSDFASDTATIPRPDEPMAADLDREEAISGTVISTEEAIIEAEGTPPPEGAAEEENAEEPDTLERLSLQGEILEGVAQEEKPAKEPRPFATSSTELDAEAAEHEKDERKEKDDDNPFARL